MVGWEEFDRIEPIGRSLDRWQMALLLAFFYNANRDPKKSSEKTTEDFLPRGGRGRTRGVQQQPLDDQIAAVKRSTAAMRQRAAAEKKKAAARAAKRQMKQVGKVAKEKT